VIVDYLLQRAASNTWVLVMRALSALLTVVGFATTFAVLFVASVILAATIHKALASSSTFAGTEVCERPNSC
jgi:hypothetical protein